MERQTNRLVIIKAGLQEQIIRDDTLISIARYFQANGNRRLPAKGRVGSIRLLAGC